MIFHVLDCALECRDKNGSKKLCGIPAGDIAYIKADCFFDKLALILAVIQRIIVLDKLLRLRHDPQRELDFFSRHESPPFP